MEILKIYDDYEEYKYAFDSKEDLDKAVKIILDYEDKYDYSDAYGGFYGQVEQIFKKNGINYSIIETNIETENVITLSV